MVKINGRKSGRPGQLVFMFYNVENLFNPSDDPSPADDPFTPEGDRHWSFYRYRKKLDQLSKVILASNAWEPPALICLSEIENETVLKDLVNHRLLMRIPYEILHRDSPDHRGMDVAMLFRSDRLTCLDTTWIMVGDECGNQENTREMLTAVFNHGNDTIIAGCVHWTSNYGGAMESETKRMHQSIILASALDSLNKARPGAMLIVGGDFNADSKAPSIRNLMKTGRLREAIPQSEIATYKYQGDWESIDHVFVGGPGRTETASEKERLARCGIGGTGCGNHTDESAVRRTGYGIGGTGSGIVEAGCGTGEAGSGIVEAGSAVCTAYILESGFLLETDEKYTGLKPFRTYFGYSYHGGISDHLPLLLHLTLPESRADHSPPSSPTD